MSIDCSLLLCYAHGIRCAHLDRLYVFEKFTVDEWVDVEVAIERFKPLLTEVLDATNDTYRAYWLGYAGAVLQQVCDERVLRVGIFSEQHPIQQALWEARKSLGLSYNTREVIPVDT